MNKSFFEGKIVVAEGNHLVGVGLEAVLKMERVSNLLRDNLESKVDRTFTLNDTVDQIRNNIVEAHGKVLLLLGDIGGQEINEELIEYIDEVTRTVDLALYILPISAYPCVNEEISSKIIKV